MDGKETVVQVLFKIVFKNNRNRTWVVESTK